MTRFDKVVQILDAAVGGPAASAGIHGAFWRGTTRDAFVVKKVFGLPLITLGKGADSILVKALKGELPFGADTGNDTADYNRMPSGLPPVPPGDIAFIQKWIDDGCPEDPVVAVAALTWAATNAPVASSRTDDIWFTDPLTGWAVNSDGHILKTTDGGDTWTEQHSAPGVYLRCVGFANANVGWVGTLTRSRRLFYTPNGGTTWTSVANVPATGPVAVCGISVVNEQVVYAAGTNRPSDAPKMLKTTDGGATWSVIDMAAHASILIDTFFTDANHGWVVGGKANQPTPTTRDKLKPVVLETTDGGVTWTNRLAGQEASFPFGEWGWKIQFLTPQLGYVSLENFTAGAILKTTDGGQTWTRMVINDPQGNVNLEGVGFIDEQHGWVGGWGSDFAAGEPTGFSSATSDGGTTWTNANEIGLRINRFRFFGSPVTVGYASGFTVYKYAARAVVPRAAVALAPARRPLLPDAHTLTNTLPVAVRMDIPFGTKRLTLHVWDRFGVDYGIVLDEVRPAHGARSFVWDGTSPMGTVIDHGDYILRLNADDTVASSTVTYRPRSPARAPTVAVAPAHAPRKPMPDFVRPQPPKLRTIAALMEAPTHDLTWLKNALQIAIQLELATLPPYLTARWTLKNMDDDIGTSILEIRGEEMAHFGTVCNLLVALDGTPLLSDPTVVPTYPGPLPGGVQPGLIVPLRKLSIEQAKVFMQIERPQYPPLNNAGAAKVYTIGAFYSAILKAFDTLQPALLATRQISRTGHIPLPLIATLADVKAAIDLINVQGEGSQTSPEEADGDLAHYYRFGELANGKRLVKGPDGKWDYTGDPLPALEVWNMADIPAGGYLPADVPDVAVRDLLHQFDMAYSNMLRNLQAAWTGGGRPKLRDAITNMNEMADFGTQLIQTPKPDGSGNYGPCFRYVP